MDANRLELLAEATSDLESGIINALQVRRDAANSEDERRAMQSLEDWYWRQKANGMHPFVIATILVAELSNEIERRKDEHQVS